jgi:hypothetical protein
MVVPTDAERISHPMKTRLVKSLLSFTAVAALAVPAVAHARNGSDDPPNHVRREHHRVHHRRHGSEHRLGHERHANTMCLICRVR